MKWTYALICCSAVLLGLNLLLVRQNRQLKAQLALPPAAYELPTGSQVPDLNGFDFQGAPFRLAFGQDPRKALIFVYSPTCGFCAKNWPQWWKLMPGLDPASVRPVAVDVTSTSTAGFLIEHRLNGMPVLMQVEPNARMKYRFQLTPQTILVDSAGRVERIWSGVLSDGAVAELQQLAGSRKMSQSGGSQLSTETKGKETN